MSILEKLKAIGIHIPKLREIISIKFSSLISVDKSVHIEGSTVIIDPSKLSGKQRNKLKHLIREDVLELTGAIVDEKSAPTVGAVIEALPSMEETAKKFIPIIPAADVPLLRACLFLRKRFELNAPVEDLKRQIVSVYGARGRNFANLCSAGYLEEWFAPLYDELVRANPDDPAAAKIKFQMLYNTILNELPWTEFVSARSSAAVVTQHIVEKMRRNVDYGVRYLNVHGLGERNVKTVQSALPDIEKQIGAHPVRMDRDPARIFVRLEIPPQT